MGAVLTALETRAAESSGAVARYKNTERVFVSPAEFGQIAVTGTWALEEASNVPSLATDDAGSTNILSIPFPVAFSDLAAESADVDRGVRIVGLEVIYQVAASALGAMDCTIYRNTLTAAGVVSAAAVTDTTTWDTDGDDGTEIDTHVVRVSIAARDRTFVDSAHWPSARLSLTDGTSSDVNIFGAVWHIERTAE